MSDCRNCVFLLKGSLTEASPQRFRDILGDLGRLEKLKQARRIFVKVNLCAGSAMKPDSGANVSSHLTEGLIRGLRHVNPEAAILIGESDSVGFGFAHDKFTFLGYDRLAKDWPGVEIIDLTRTGYVKIEDPRGSLPRFMLPRAALDSDFVISLSKIKTHNIVTVTGAMKNHFGTLPHQFKNTYHPRLHRVIVDVNRHIATDLAIIDGNPAMEGNGPVRGTPKPLDLTVLGDNVVAADACMARLMGFEPRKIRYLRLARKAGLGEIEADRIQIAGDAVENTQRFRFISLKKRLIMKVSLSVQGLGIFIQDWGHLAHYADAISDVRRVAKYLKRRFGASPPP